MSQGEIIKYEGGLIKRASSVISVTTKILAIAESQLIPYRKKTNGGFPQKIKRLL